ncbi:MAG: hypothetical protein JNL59_07130 [Chitinophagaceae bacterium]|jgi:hypothetical protein|nr:hypothetical protein [Chitinophagaceae bacterium]
MAQRIFLVLVVLFFPFSGEIFAQQKVVEKNFAVPSFLDASRSQDSLPGQPGVAFFPAKKNVAIPSFFQKKLQPVAPSFYIRNLSFICRKEWQFQKTTGIPLRIRLGSLEYVDRLEGKRKEVQ